MTSNTPTQSSTPPKPSMSRTFAELIICIILPTLILKKLSGDDSLGSHQSLILALCLPLFFGLYEFYESRKIKFVPALGFISILLTGSIGLLELDSKYIAIKEALIPAVLGIATLISSYTKYPLIRTFLYNDMVMETGKVAEALHQHSRQDEFDSIMIKATWVLASSFFFSAILNFLLAQWIVVSPSGTAAFNDELGTMNLMSYPIIALPCLIIMMMVLFYVIKNITRLTGLSLEEIIRQ